MAANTACDSMSGGAHFVSHAGRVITVRWGDCVKRIGIDGSPEAIKEVIKSALGLRTTRSFWLENDSRILRSIYRDMPLGSYSLHLDEEAPYDRLPYLVIEVNGVLVSIQRISAFIEPKVSEEQYFGKEREVLRAYIAYETRSMGWGLIPLRQPHRAWRVEHHAVWNIENDAFRPE
ncbi:hypothetical protein Cgig2_011901 [Carnegiea gigantea]|uniref:Uncharacterized protein n=1 Tax=Carnegiea gigantea TaxID=171969 RepID=A0A9Q1Q6T1_9CARY|nr:hypothetical protein Cgig2_011901 [Carnegiea gigantea]